MKHKYIFIFDLFTIYTYKTDLIVLDHSKYYLIIIEIIITSSFTLILSKVSSIFNKRNTMYHQIKKNI